MQPTQELQETDQETRPYTLRVESSDLDQQLQALHQAIYNYAAQLGIVLTPPSR